MIGAARDLHRARARARSPSSCPALAYAARTVGSPQIRNAGTIGGNLATASPAGDTLPGARRARRDRSRSPGRRGTRRRARRASSSRVRSVRCSAPGELVVAVRVPVRRGPQDYLKVGVRNAMVIAVASLAIVVDLDARSVGVGLGSVGPTPLAAPEACAWIAARAALERRRRPAAPDDAGGVRDAWSRARRGRSTTTAAPPTTAGRRSGCSRAARSSGARRERGRTRSA